tara:strand:- start:345 stop:500 length:156 start_codon:yes stop_codon:yes gene_type:complete
LVEYSFFFFLFFLLLPVKAKGVEYPSTLPVVVISSKSSSSIICSTKDLTKL